MDALDAKATTTLRETAVEATPLLLPSHSNVCSYEYASLCSAIDAWKGHHDANALARREQEKLDAAAPGRGHSTEVEKLERRLKQQEQALEGFAKKSKNNKRLVMQSKNIGRMLKQSFNRHERLSKSKVGSLF